MSVSRLLFVDKKSQKAQRAKLDDQKSNRLLEALSNADLSLVKSYAASHDIIRFRSSVFGSIGENALTALISSTSLWSHWLQLKLNYWESGFENLAWQCITHLETSEAFINLTQQDIERLVGNYCRKYGYVPFKNEIEKTLIKFQRDLNNKYQNIKKIIDFLIGEGVNVNLPDRDYYPLQYAINNADTLLVKYLIQKGADVNTLTSSGSISSLESLLDQRHIRYSTSDQVNVSGEILKILLAEGASPLFSSKYAESFMKRLQKEIQGARQLDDKGNIKKSLLLNYLLHLEKQVERHFVKIEAQMQTPFEYGITTCESYTVKPMPKSHFDEKEEKTPDRIKKQIQQIQMQSIHRKIHLSFVGSKASFKFNFEIVGLIFSTDMLTFHLTSNSNLIKDDFFERMDKNKTKITVLTKGEKRYSFTGIIVFQVCGIFHAMGFIPDKDTLITNLKNLLISQEDRICREFNNKEVYDDHINIINKFVKLFADDFDKGFVSYNKHLADTEAKKIAETKAFFESKKPKPLYPPVNKAPEEPKLDYKYSP